MHLELVEDVTSGSFQLGALKRFISRRGKIINMYSVNGTNFLGADNELRSLFEKAAFKTDFQDAATEERMILYLQGPLISVDYGRQQYDPCNNI